METQHTIFLTNLDLFCAFVTPPEEAGQTVQCSYATCAEGIVRRTYDASDREETYALCDWDDWDDCYDRDEYDPANGMPDFAATWLPVTA